MSQIKIHHLSFAYEDAPEPIFEDLNLVLDSDWKLGFIGRNGRGKTTFLKILTGQLPYSGQIQKSVSFDYFPYSVPNQQATCQMLWQQLATEIPLWQAEREFALLQLPTDILDRVFATLSQGEQNKFLLALLFLRENHFLLIDEPTNHLDIASRQIVCRYLQKKKGFLLVSHDRVFLDQCIDHVLSIDKKGMVLQKGNFSTWQENKNREDAFELAEHEKRQKEIKQLAKAAKAAAQWSEQTERSKKQGRDASGIKPDRGYIGHKSAKMMKRAKSMEARKKNALVEKEKLLQNIEKSETLKLQPLVYWRENLIEANDLCLYYGQKQVAGPLHFTLNRGERLAICGKNGSGKSTLLKLILGQEIAYQGVFSCGGQMQLSSVAQDPSFLKGDFMAWAAQAGIDSTLFFTILRKLDFPRAVFEHDLQALSAGQKKKVLLAASMAQPAHLYVWDEPLNFIDVLSRIQIEDLLLQYQPTMVFVEHDQTFCQRIATKTLNL